MIQTEVRGIERLQAFLKTIPLGARNLVVRTIAEYIMGGKSGEGGEATHGLKHYPAYRYVSIAQSGGWKSDKQRRYVMARIREGTIDPGVPHRTGELQRGWKVKGEAYRQTIYNDTPYAEWVQGTLGQTQMHKMGGWRTAYDVAMSNMAGAMRSARAKLNEWLKSRK